MQPEIHDRIKFRKDKFASCPAGRDQLATDGQREEEKSAAFIAVVIVIQVCAVLSPICDFKPKNLLFA